MGESGGRRRKRMTLPKKKEDLEKIVEEVEASHAHDHHHHHHHHSDLDDVIAVFELLIDSMNSNIKTLEATVQAHGAEIVKLYKILAKVVEACFEEEPEKRRAALREALSIVRQASS